MRWYEGAQQQSVYVEDEPYPCTACCKCRP